ncbi:DNA-processing protein DprA [uncultured Dokdonia sp.]|uniref:DNA-processing protein DprA n=1 Tax=uncultured Dokdonia sp. TaxID=575653 RepID=UPI00261B7B15|nr:DNA-processing protein DprA [uncultured Dokdonia sp.]
MTENEFVSLLTLQHIPHLGDGSIKKLIQHFGSATAVLQQKKEHLLKIEGIGEHKLQSFWDEKYAAFAKAELEHIKTYNITYSCYTDDDYPQRLKHCIDGPVILFQRGNIQLNQRKIISIVGTRKITSYGTTFVEKFIEEIAPFNPVIVSGFAYGVDITAHKAALANNLQTIDCVAHLLLIPKNAEQSRQARVYRG